jgi:hypothetical protein
MLPNGGNDYHVIIGTHRNIGHAIAAGALVSRAAGIVLSGGRAMCGESVVNCRFRERSQYRDNCTCVHQACAQCIGPACCPIAAGVAPPKTLFFLLPGTRSEQAASQSLIWFGRSWLHAKGERVYMRPLRWGLVFSRAFTNSTRFVSLP